VKFDKDPDAVLDYVFDWGPWLAETEQIISHVITTTPSGSGGVTVDSSSVTVSKVTVWLSGGTIGRRYDVACLITTNAGRTDERTMHINVLDR